MESCIMSNFQPSRPRQQWLFRAVTKCLVTCLLLVFLGTFAHSQAIGLRWDLGVPGSAGVVTITAGSGYPPIYAVPNATLAFCGYPAVLSGAGTPCTNLVTTYTDLTLGTSCPTNAQIVLQDSVTCQASSGADGSLGINLAGGGTYTYTLTINGVTTPPFTVSIGIPGTASTPVTTPVSCPGTSTLFPITSESQTFAVTLTGNCTASALTAVSAIIPPAIVIFQITQPSGGGDTFTWPSNVIGGAVIGSASNQVTTQAFMWNGTNATAIASANLGSGPLQRAGIFDATTGFECDGSFGTIGFFLQSTGSGCTWASGGNSFLLANAASTGTTLNKLVKQTGNPATGVIAATTDVSGIIGVVASGAGTSGNATIVQGGKTALVFDGATTSNDYFTISSSVSGDGTDTGLGPPSLPPCGTQILGQVLSSNVGGGTYQVDLYPPGLYVPCQVVTPSFNAPQRVVLGSPVSLTAFTQAIILTESVTFPSAAGTYRADARYGLYVTAGANACLAEVIDTTNTLAFAVNGQDANGTGYVALSGSEISSHTYAASSTATFTLQVICNNGATGLVGATVTSGLFTGGDAIVPAEPTYLSVTPVLSN
jgi:hypothetical protein